MAAAAAASSADSDSSQAISRTPHILCHKPRLTSPTTSLSKPSEAKRPRSATTAAHRPSVWVMLPTIASGHSTIRSAPTRKLKSRTPNSASARRAHKRPPVYSATRCGDAPRRQAASSGSSSEASAGSRKSQAATPAGNSAANAADRRAGLR